jgi:hypothetical protein
MAQWCTSLFGGITWIRVKIRQWRLGCLDRVKTHGCPTRFLFFIATLYCHVRPHGLYVAASLGFEPRQRAFTYENLRVLPLRLSASATSPARFCSCVGIVDEPRLKQCGGRCYRRFLHAYTVTKYARARDRRGYDLISDALPFGQLWYGAPRLFASAVYTEPWRISKTGPFSSGLLAVFTKSFATKT